MPTARAFWGRSVCPCDSPFLSLCSSLLSGVLLETCFVLASLGPPLFQSGSPSLYRRLEPLQRQEAGDSHKTHLFFISLCYLMLNALKIIIPYVGVWWVFVCFCFVIFFSCFECEGEFGPCCSLLVERRNPCQQLFQNPLSLLLNLK